MTTWHIAQLNTSMARFPFDDPRMKPFTDSLAQMYALADQAPGFVWRPNTGSPSDSAVRSYGHDRAVINYSVWADMDALKTFVYRKGHGAAVKNMASLFEDADEANQVLWWVPIGHRPGPAEGLARLKLLRRKGPGANAFTFQAPFDCPADAA